MSFINQGKAGFIIGNVFKRSAMKGRNAFMDRRFTKQSGNPPQPPYPVDQVWLAASYDRLTFELQQEVIGVGGHYTTHTADIYSPDHEGVYHKFGINEPVWEGFRVDDGLVEINPNPEFVAGIDGYSTAQGSLSYFGGKLHWDMVDANSFIVMEGMNITTGVDYEVTIDVTSDKPLRYNVYTQGGFSGNIINGSGVITFTATGTGSLFRLYVLDSIDGSQCDFAKISVKEAAGNAYYADDGAGVLLNPLPWLKYQKAATNYAQSFMSDDTSFWGNSAPIPITDLGPSEVFPTQNKFRHASVSTTTFRGNLNAASASANTDCFVAVVESDGAPRVRLRFRDQTAGVDIGDVQFNLTSGDPPVITVPCDTTSKEIMPGIWILVMGSDSGISGNDLRCYLYPTAGGIGNSIVHYVGAFTDISVKEVAELGFIYNAIGGPGNGVATDETIYNWAAANHDDIGNSYEGDFFLSGEDQVLLSMGGVPVLSITAGGDVELTDGTLACYIPVVSAEPHIKASYGVDGMTLDVDGVTASCPYDGSLGAGVLSTKSTSRRLLRIGS